MSDTTPRPDEPENDPTAPPPEPAAPEQPAAPEEPVAAEQPPAPEEPTAPEEPVAAAQPPAPEQPAAAAYGATSAPPPPPPPGQQPPPAQQHAALPAGQAAMTPQDERTWSMATHGITLGALVVSGGTLGFVAALVMYLVYKDRGPYIRANTANALNIQITAIIGVVISFVLMLVIIGFFTLIAVVVWALVMHIIGIVKANNGEWWDPPLTPKFVR